MEYFNITISIDINDIDFNTNLALSILYIKKYIHDIFNKVVNITYNIEKNNNFYSITYTISNIIIPTKLQHLIIKELNLVDNWGLLYIGNDPLYLYIFKELKLLNYVIDNTKFYIKLVNDENYNEIIDNIENIYEYYINKKYFASYDVDFIDNIDFIKLCDDWNIEKIINYLDNSIVVYKLSDIDLFITNPKEWLIKSYMNKYVEYNFYIKFDVQRDDLPIILKYLIYMACNKYNIDLLYDVIVSYTNQITLYVNSYNDVNTIIDYIKQVDISLLSVQMFETINDAIIHKYYYNLIDKKNIYFIITYNNNFYIIYQYPNIKTSNLLYTNSLDILWSSLYRANQLIKASNPYQVVGYKPWLPNILSLNINIIN